MSYINSDPSGDEIFFLKKNTPNYYQNVENI